MSGMADGLRGTKVVFYCSDQNPHRDRSLGITSYTRGLMTHLAAVAELEVTAITSKSSFKVPAGIAEQRLPFATDSLPLRMIVDHLHPCVARGGAALWHYPKGFLPVVAPPKRPVVNTVHDTILQHYAQHYPHTRSKADFAYWLYVLKKSLQRTDAVLTVSEHARESIVRFCEGNGIAPPPIHVTYQGVNIAPAAAATPRKGDFVLHLASALPHKRTAWLCETWRQLQQDDNDLPPLVLVGALDQCASAVVAQMSGVQTRPHVASDEVFQLMATASAVVLPSEIEGFGLPAVEAYRLGTPVAYVRETAVEEILGHETAGGFEFRQDSFAAALDAVLNLSSEEVQRTAAELERRYSWDECVRRTVDAYTTVL
jgi:glycosyltransferase involved in cell wall biosynthesis